MFGCQWPRGVTISTLDPESSDRGSNPCEAFLQEHARTGAVRTKGVKTLTHACVAWVRRCPLGSRSLFSGVALAAVGSGLRAPAPGGCTVAELAARRSHNPGVRSSPAAIAWCVADVFAFFARRRTAAWRPLTVAGAHCLGTLVSSGARRWLLLCASQVAGRPRM